ncbi:hypothetical protein SAMN05421736_10232 [Evansella caseinilytica]|uniref:Uncharacterized protein n=1 Tax=Evansella caseinilytica TaxID=1503961 RepID=A0A1H3K2K0_9BACI|nr:hypothetical protein SAMN05421736_10232 [Evansella caseinilytica]
MCGQKEDTTTAGRLRWGRLAQWNIHETIYVRSGATTLTLKFVDKGLSHFPGSVKCTYTLYLTIPFPGDFLNILKIY